MRLFIAEKPELAKAIVEGLGGGSKQDGYYDCGSDYVTWCFGHMLQLYEPADYDEQYAKWNMDDLPIVHVPWRKKPNGDGSSKAQLKKILGLLKQADSVAHAGDPDDEGQYLVDEILEYANYKGKVERLLINDNNLKVVKRALANMRDNREFKGLSAAAEARDVGDQLYGVNVSRAYTLAAQKKGYQGVLTVGRVQTPILGLVVRRCRENSSHKKAYYYDVSGQFSIGDVDFKAAYQPQEGDILDDKKRLSDENQANAIANEVSDKPATIKNAETKHKEQDPPLPYNLLKLQMDASRKFGLKPDQVKDITQSLREKHKLITYNRSDCEYLSDEQHDDAPGVLTAIGQTAPMLAKAAEKGNPGIKSRAFDSSKVSAHHAIIPTETVGELDRLTDAEKKIYLLVARAYVAQFWPKHEYDQTTIEAEVEGRIFRVRANVTTSPGWMLLYKNDAGNDELEKGEEDSSDDLRQLSAGQQGQCLQGKVAKKETKPKPLYTMSTLLSDLTSVAKYIKDEKLRKTLVEKDKDKKGEHGGIGTPATRDSIIANLFERQLLAENDKKKIVATRIGEELYDALPDGAKYPDMTAVWHEQQKGIQDGNGDAVSFINGLTGYIEGEVANIRNNGLNIKVKVHPCPQCERPLKRVKRKKDGKFFWSCTGREEGCDYACNDANGNPVPKEVTAVSKQFKCMKCGRGLIRRKGSKGYFWGCSGYSEDPQCKQTYPDMKGRPNYGANRKATPKQRPTSSNAK